jgi:hypothetical protein
LDEIYIPGKLEEATAVWYCPDDDMATLFQFVVALVPLAVTTVLVVLFAIAIAGGRIY